MLTDLERRMLNFIGNYLRESDGRSPTLSEVGKGCGVKSVGTVHRYLTSIENKGYLERARKGWRTRVAPSELPFLGKIAAGEPIEAIEQAEVIDLASLLAQPDCFVLKVEGDSMTSRGIHDGDLAIVRSCETAQNGDIVVAIVDGDATLKRFEKIDGGRRIKLVPYNENFNSKIYEADEVQIKGILTSVIRTNP